ncbi:MAG: DUF6687 family protein [Acidimicrobiales bacterium]|jgi:hypothetical protein
MSRALGYLPVEELEGRPHVLVDGAARAGSVLTLSHWPQSPTPPALVRDLSAQIVFAFLHAFEGRLALGAPATHRGQQRRSGVEIKAALAAFERAQVVTNDHFDEDGVVSVFAMADPETALSHEELLVDVASCGDFGVVRSRQAARIAFAIGPIAAAAEAAELSLVAERPGSWSGPRYRAVLERLVELIEHTEAFRSYWAEQDAVLVSSEEDLSNGSVVIEEVGEVDLAVVRRLRGTAPPGSVAAGAVPLSAVALHSATPASRVLAFNGGRCELYLRYESWVRYVSRQVPRRPDLAPLAAQLSALEPSGLRWSADGVGSLVTRMRPEPDGETDLDPAVVSRLVVAYLKSAPPAWDPFRRAGALIPMSERRWLR